MLFSTFEALMTMFKKKGTNNHKKLFTIIVQKVDNDTKFKSLKILCGPTKNTKNLNYDKLVNKIEAKAA
jgi:hypothetical protein